MVVIGNFWELHRGVYKQMFHNIPIHKNCTLVQWVDAIKALKMQNILLMGTGHYEILPRNILQYA